MFRYAWIVWVLVLLAGCVPERVVWSPDGSRAVVLAGDGMRMMDPEGKLGPLMMEGISRVAWMPDGKRLVVAGSLTVTGWEELLVTIPGSAHDPVATNKVRAAIVASGGDWKKFEELSAELTQDARIRALLYLRDKDPKFPDTAGALWPQVVEVSYSVPICYLLHVDGVGEASPGPVIFYGMQGTTVEMRVSGAGLVAVTLTSHGNSPEAGAARLFVASTQRGKLPLKFGESCTHVDWAADGKSILYMRPAGGDANGSKAGTLSRQGVVGDDGELLSREQLPPRDDLAAVVFEAEGRVRCAGNGRVFFWTAGTGPVGTVPAAAEKPTLYSLRPGVEGAAVAAIAPGAREQAGDALQYFVPSPDGSRVILPFGDGRLSMLTVSTGEVAPIQAATVAGAKNELTTVPTWRGNGEVTFVRPPADGGRVRELVRYSVTNGKAVVLSTGWDDNVRQEWLIPAPADNAAEGFLP